MLMKSLVLASLLLGQSPDPQELNEFFQRVWSPYCKGNSLLECPSGAAIELRDELKSMYLNGASLEELELALKKEYGDRVQMEPPFSWRGQLAYLLPWLAFFIALFGIFMFWKKRTKSMNQSLPADPIAKKPANSDALKRLEDELAERM